MKPSSLNEVFALLRRPELQSWWTSVQQRRADLESAQRTHRELLTEAALSVVVSIRSWRLSGPSK